MLRPPAPSCSASPLSHSVGGSNPAGALISHYKLQYFYISLKAHVKLSTSLINTHRSDSGEKHNKSWSYCESLRFTQTMKSMRGINLCMWNCTTHPLILSENRSTSTKDRGNKRRTYVLKFQKQFVPRDIIQILGKWAEHLFNREKYTNTSHHPTITGYKHIKNHV